MGDGKFAPDARVTGDQMRAMIGRSLGDEVANRALPEYAGDDAPMTRGRAAQALARAYRARLHLP